MSGPTGLDGEARLHVLRTLVETGRAPSTHDTAAALGVDEEAAAGAYRRLAEERAIVLAPGTLNVWMANPLSAVPSAFTVETGGRRHYANCIWDALGAVAMLGGEGRVDTSCPDCGATLPVLVEGGEPLGKGIVHFAVPAARWWENIGYT